MPLALAVLALLLSSWALLGFAIYPLQVLRLARRIPSEQAFFTVLGKFPEALGALEFHMNRLRGRKREILEYK